ncbi:MAG: NlpC/P60 family protein [Balneolaceae bacterium]
MCTQVNSSFLSANVIGPILLLLFLASCGVAGQQRASNTEIRPSSELQRDILNALNQAHQDWKGTPYILGGSGISGVDCSSFTQIVFDEYFGFTLPRNTRQQLREGSSIRRNYIRPGDLIFFRTGRSLLHVGVAMEDGRFLHASVSSGVMISSIDQRYWASRYLATRRIL